MEVDGVVIIMGGWDWVMRLVMMRAREVGLDGREGRLDVSKSGCIGDAG